MKVSDILDTKGSRVVFVGPDITLREALSTMVEKKVGALPVLDGSARLLGIITERDLMREVYAKTDLEKRNVGDVMTVDVQYAELDDEVEQVMHQMTEGRFRHVPVIEEQRLVGIVSIGDMVKSQLNHVKRQFEDLRDYVAGPAA